MNLQFEIHVIRPVNVESDGFEKTRRKAADQKLAPVHPRVELRAARIIVKTISGLLRNAASIFFKKLTQLLLIF